MIIHNLIKDKLNSALSIEQLEITDESYMHKGHAGAREEGETHFNITIISENFDSLSRIERHRLIYDILSEELKDRIHALKLKTVTPEEYNSKDKLS